MSRAERSFDGKVALITGGTSGIGRGTVLFLSKLGCNVAFGGRNKAELDNVAAKCKETRKDAQILPVQGDLEKEKDVKALLDATIKHFGKLDILVNNAGIAGKGTIKNTSLEDFDKVMNINVRAVFYLTSLAVPYLTKTKGCVVNVSSLTGLRSVSWFSLLNHRRFITVIYRLNLSMFVNNQLVTNFSPGVIKTEIQKRGGMSEEEYQKFLERCKETHALGRHGEVEEVVSVIAFLASSDSSFMTGATLPVDGGRHAMCPHEGPRAVKFLSRI
ncbi:PREDICTED: 3-oxoacyl-[acyl-carrier-protein] reductase FabG-like [Acropora digitifera]|uniref:3-oxoacyl-[acyl-carrier-protein] reductase FabG-like n=1 Tax=Acropora digitifera TaxID=70779 RepID=UPI00077A500D|nr:PREDICTED: 3-oxoacyl-[acyl-carrier-protein] reductase FabG-like [Acropora digitifera]